MTSAVTLAETLVKPLKANDCALANLYRAMFYHTSGITVAGVSAVAGETAAELRARYNLRTPDALHVAVAIDAGCKAFLTNDAAIKRVTDITVLTLNELETGE